MVRRSSTKTKKAPAPKSPQVFITASGRIFSDDDLKRFEMPQSQQLDAIQFKGLRVINPPFDLAKLMQWMDISVAHNAAIRTKVQDSVGIGWHLEQIDESASEVDRELLEEFFSEVNEVDDINSLSKKVYTDLEGSGNGYIEIARGADNKVSGLFHIPAITVRVHISRRKYVQMIGSKKVWFKLFGESKAMNKNTGNFETVAKPEDVANEIIHLKTYTWRSQHYGLPEWLPAVFPMFGEQKEKEYNINFFGSFGIPAYAVILKGMALNPDIEDAIKRYFETEIKGNPHKTMVFTTPEGGEIEFQPLNVTTKEASFRVFRRDNRDDILTAHRVPPYRAGIVVQGQLGGKVASEVDRIYLTSVINPRQAEYERIINRWIVSEGLGVEGWEFHFDDILIDDRLAQAQIDQILFNMGARNANEIRQAIGDEPYDGGDDFFISSSLVPPSVAGLGLSAEEAAARAAGEKDEGGTVDGKWQPPQDIASMVKVGRSATPLFTLDKRRKPAIQRDVDKVNRRFTKEMLKEFARQERATQKFFRDDGVYQAVQDVARRRNPELFDKRRNGARFYEDIEKQLDPADRREIEAIISGWERFVAPETMAPVLEKFSVEAGNLGGVNAMRRLGVRARFDLKNPAVLDALKRRGNEITGSVTERTRQDLVKVLSTRFFEEGAGLPAVAKDIKGLFEETYKKRSLTIARTETGIAFEEVNAAANMKNGIAKKQWLAFLDSETRDAHVDAHLQIVPINQPFDVGGEALDHPLDSAGSPGNIINCRCTEIPVIDESVNPPETPWTGQE